MQKCISAYTDGRRVAYQRRQSANAVRANNISQHSTMTMKAYAKKLQQQLCKNFSAIHSREDYGAAQYVPQPPVYFAESMLLYLSAMAIGSA